jgi:hypothetical protein
MNDLERSTIAKSVATYIIDHLFVDEPIASSEFMEIVTEVAKDKTSKDLNIIVGMAVKYINEDPRVVISPEMITLK